MSTFLKTIRKPFGIIIPLDEVKRRVLGQLIPLTCTCGCEMLIYFRALVLRFSWREVDDDA